MRLPAVLATVLLLALTGCGQSSAPTTGFEGEEADVAQVVGDLADAGQRNEPAEICGSVVSDELRQEIAAAGSTCEAEMRRAIEDADGFELDVEDVTITGDEATARVRGTDAGEDVVRTFELERSGDEWRIASFG